MARFSCTVCVPHVDTPGLLRCCIENILHHQHPDVSVEVIIVDQSGEQMNRLRAHGYQNYKRDMVSIRVIDARRIDAGYPIDLAVRQATGEYFCSLDCDAWPLNAAWLAQPIEQIHRCGFSFVGCDCDLAKNEAYQKFGTDWSVINNFYRVSRTDVARRASEAVGFIRPTNKHRAEIAYGNEWPFNAWIDNGVAANWWVDRQGGLGPKLIYPITRHLGNAHGRRDCCVYGIIVAELVFHLGYGFHPDTVGDAKTQLGEEFLRLHASFDQCADPVAYAKHLADESKIVAFVAW